MNKKRLVPSHSSFLPDLHSVERISTARHLFDPVNAPSFLEATRTCSSAPGVRAHDGAMPPHARTAIKPPQGPAKGGGLETPKISTRKAEKQKSAGTGISAKEEPAGPPASAAAKSRSKGSPAPGKVVGNAGSGPSYAAATGNKKRAKQTRAERLAEEEQIDYGSEGGW